MDINQLRTRLRQLGVKPPGDIPPEMRASFNANYELRNSLYLQRLIDTQTFFTQTMSQPHDPVNNPDGMGTDYAFVKAAVTSTNLISELAETLDLFVSPAVDRDMKLVFGKNSFTFQQYFNQRIFDPNDVTYAAKVQAFMNCFPITSAAVQAITANFRRNIRQACARIVQDKTAIQNLLKDKYPFLTLKSLKHIRSTGSDFHKGGQQVLILTFSVSYVGRYPMLDDDLKVVYKPSDIEVDCLVIGDSTAVKRADPNFNITLSLTEIVNGLIDEEQENNPNSTLELLPTYRILPRDYTSTRAAGFPVPQILDAYGYIEYLDYDESYGPGFYYYPLGQSDFVIYFGQNEEPIIKKFYRQMGQLVALACTFSLLDLHLQNVRVMKYTPFLIDLEISLVTPVNDASETVLLGHYGGITAETLAGEEYVWDVAPTPGGNQVEMKQVHLTKRFQNRLYALRPSKKVVPPNVYYIVRGYNRMMEILQTAVKNNSFNNWLARLDGVLVRYTPFATSQFKRIRDRIYQTPMETNFGDQLAPTIQTKLASELSSEFQTYQQTPTTFPDYVALQNAVCAPDYLNVDIPVFYHRIGTTELLDSRGAVVAVPAQVTVNGALQNTNLGRATFFAAAPTAANVQQAQLQVLAHKLSFDRRRQALRKTILAGLGRLSPPDKPGVLIP